MATRFEKHRLNELSKRGTGWKLFDARNTLAGAGQGASHDNQFGIDVIAGATPSCAKRFQTRKHSVGLGKTRYCWCGAFGIPVLVG
jgi:Na+-transporting NADH:ubiquinone oxidoreductase subunit NqrC